MPSSPRIRISMSSYFRPIAPTTPRSPIPVLEYIGVGGIASQNSLLACSPALKLQALYTPSNLHMQQRRQGNTPNISAETGGE